MLTEMQVSLSHPMTLPTNVAPYALSTLYGAFAKTNKAALTKQMSRMVIEYGNPPFYMGKQVHGRMGQVVQK